jgi:hypothetical protein
MLQEACQLTKVSTSYETEISTQYHTEQQGPEGGSYQLETKIPTLVDITRYKLQPYAHCCHGE